MKMARKQWSRLLALTWMLSLLLGGQAAADYCLVGGDGASIQSTPDAYEVTQVVGMFEGGILLRNPQDIYITDNDILYIADTGNNRVLAVDRDGAILHLYDGVYGSDPRPLNSPQGVFADEEGHVFIADTENNRIVHLLPDGTFVEEFTQPTEDTYDTAYAFKPSKLAIDEMGILYIANAYDYHGLLTLNAKNQFLGYVGATKVGFSLTEALIRLFATEEQKEALERQMPAYFSNFFLKDGLIYATSYWDKASQIKKLSPSGTNIYPGGVYGETNDDEMFNGLPGFADVAVDQNEVIYAADLVTGKIYVYNQEGNNLAVTGGRGRRELRFEAISAIEVDSQGNIYVLDSICGTVQVLSPTRYMSAVIEATRLTSDGLYQEALEPWQEVLSYDSSNFLANEGTARAAYENGDFETAQRLYELNQDKKGYSLAFVERRMEAYRSHFLLVVGAVVVLLAAVLLVLSRVRRFADAMADRALCEAPRFGLRHVGRSALLMLWHPIDCLRGIKTSRRKLRIWHSLLLLAALVIVRIAYIYTVHYPLSGLSLLTVDVLQQVAILLLPLLSFVLVNFGITSISDGKQTLMETLYASLAAFMPYILFSLPLAALSHLLSAQEGGFYAMLEGGLLVWSLLLLLLSVKQMNEYSMKKLIYTVLKSLFGVICLWMIVLLVYIIVYQSVDFFYNLSVEYRIAYHS